MINYIQKILLKNSLKNLATALILLLLNSPAFSFSIKELFLNKNQQGQLLMEQKKYAQASDVFDNQEWKAGALYKAQKYSAAQKLYANIKTADGFYNQGNALAFQEKYKEALAAYNSAIKLNPQHEDAIYNKKIIEDLLKQQKNQENKQQNNPKNKDNTQQKSDQNNKDDQQNNDNQQSSQDNENEQDNEQTDNDKNKKPQDLEQEQSEVNQNSEKKNEQEKAEEQEKEAKKSETRNQEMQQSQKDQELNNRLLKLIPDDPGGLMREKFLRDHLKRHKEWR